MSMSLNYAGTAVVALVLGLTQGACNSGARGGNETAAAPIDAAQGDTAAPPPTDTGRSSTTAIPTDTARSDTAAAPTDAARSDAAAAPVDTTVARPPAAVAAPPSAPPVPKADRDTPPAGAAQPSGRAPGGGGPKVSQVEYEGWRQYSVNCARCHGQDVLPNPVAANLLVSLAPGGPMEESEKFFQVVNEGRPERGMPAFKSILTPDQIKAIYAYVKGRAEKRIPPGRPASPSA